MKTKKVIGAIAKNFSIPTKSKVENAKSILHFQIGKIIFDLKRE